MDRNLTKNEITSRRLRTLAKYTTGVAVVGIGIWLVSTCSGESVSESSLRFATVDTGEIETSVIASGRVVPATEEIIVSPVASRILEVYSKVGDLVDNGTPLLRLDLEASRNEYQSQNDQLDMMRLDLERLRAQNETTLNELTMQVRVAEMQLSRLESELANERYLDSIGGGTTEQVNKVAYELRSARLDLDRLRQKLANEKRIMSANERSKLLEIEIKNRQLALNRRQLDDAEIRSPRRATVTSIASEIGATVGQGQVMATVADLGHFKVEGSVNDTYGRDVKPGDRVRMNVARQSLNGSVTGVSPTSTNGLYEFTVALDCDSASGLRPGLKPDIYISTGLISNALRLPNENFYTEPGAYTFFVDTGDGRLERRAVKLGKASYDYVEVVSGLRQGERVVISDMKSYTEKEYLKLK